MASYAAARTRLPTGYLRAMPAMALAKNWCFTVQPNKTSSIVLNGPSALLLVVPDRGLTAD